jgi:hypothetical protein
MPYRGRNTVYLHNTLGENIYLFESAINTSLSNDIETLILDIEKLGMVLKRKTLMFDRGGYSRKCFAFLNSKKMYFGTYLKNRKKEREVPFDQFTKHLYRSESGDEFEYFIFEKERRWIRNVLVRVIIFLGTENRQIPILTSNPFLKSSTVVYYLQRRWREENSFKYMGEHFGIDLMTTYKTEEAPEKIIQRANPKRQEINNKIKSAKNLLKNLRNQLADKMMTAQNQSVEDFLEGENQLRFEIKNAVVDIDFLERERKKISSKIEINLKNEYVIIAQKRRLLINAIKAINYNAEKWMQTLFLEYHSRPDETLSVVRNLWRQPGRIRFAPGLVEVALDAIDYGPTKVSLEKVLKKINETSGLRLPDGKILKIYCSKN